MMPLLEHPASSSTKRPFTMVDSRFIGLFPLVADYFYIRSSNGWEDLHLGVSLDSRACDGDHVVIARKEAYEKVEAARRQVDALVA
jgi:hypothetical protein